MFIGASSSDVTVDEIIPKSDGLGILGCTAVVHRFDVGPDARTKTHRAGVAGSVQNGTAQVVALVRLTGLPDDIHFSVAGGIMAAQYGI